MSRRDYQLQVDYHPPGNRTLKQREVGELMWADLRSKDLFANSDSASFYKAVADHVVQLSSRGHKVVGLVDTSDAA